MAYKLGMTAQLNTHHSNAATDDGNVSSGGNNSREWEGRDDSEGMRQRRMAASGSSATRSKWLTQPQRMYRPAVLDNAEDEEEEEEEEQEEEEEEEEEDGDEVEQNDDVDESYEEDNNEPLDVAMGRLGIAPSTSSWSSSVSTGVSPSVYEEAVNLLAALSFQQLISSEQLSLFVSLLTQQHPLFLSALLAYQQTSDIDDLLDTLNKVHKRLSGQQPASGQQRQQQHHQALSFHSRSRTARG